MLRGHVFDEQLFSSKCFALFIDTFLAKNCGVIKGCELSNATNSVTISNGFFCIRGRFLEIEGSDTLSTGTDNAYCKLVCEVDLTKENTESELTQAVLKIVKSTIGYPTLTQQDITNDGSIYQFEFAQFRTGSTGITDFVDTRKFLDFDSIYSKVNTETQVVIEKIKEELRMVENGSGYFLKNDIAVVSGVVTLSDGNGSISAEYPSGFNKENCRVISFMARNTLQQSNKGFCYGFLPTAAGYVAGAIGHEVLLRDDNIVVNICNPADSENGNLTYDIEILLLKINNNPLIIFGELTSSGTSIVTIKDLPEDYVVASNYELTLNSQNGTTREYTISGLNTSGGTDMVAIMISNSEGEPFYEAMHSYSSES